MGKQVKANFFWQALAICMLGLGALILSTRGGDAELVEGHPVTHLAELPVAQIVSQVAAPPAIAPATTPADASGLLSKACGLRPNPKPHRPTRQELAPVQVQLGLDRFRLAANSTDFQTPREKVFLAHPTNFGLRYQQDINGKDATHQPIVVLHETVASAESTIRLFQTPHANDADQISYHTLIDRDGTVIYLVPPDRRAFGAGNSLFNGEGVKTNSKLPPSVNNFAYHISLVTPSDGMNQRSTHSGYTQAQYESLAWVVAKTGVPASRLTAHKLIDRSGSRSDPRSFDGPAFLQLLQRYSQSQAISIACTPVTLQAQQGRSQARPL
jgi:N-acetyl-anhydromuramyl-L-alanine amidase AmpD